MCSCVLQVFVVSSFHRRTCHSVTRAYVQILSWTLMDIPPEWRYSWHQEQMFWEHYIFPRTIVGPIFCWIFNWPKPVPHIIYWTVNQPSVSERCSFDTTTCRSVCADCCSSETKTLLPGSSALRLITGFQSAPSLAPLSSCLTNYKQIFVASEASAMKREQRVEAYQTSRVK